MAEPTEKPVVSETYIVKIDGATYEVCSKYVGDITFLYPAK